MVRPLTYTASQDQPLISIIIPTLNSAEIIKECLNSIEKQLIKNLEIVIADGGSTDNTIAICKEYPGKLKWISEKDDGIYDALNKGVEEANGRWLYFLGTDDRLLPGFSELAIKLKDPSGIYYGNSDPHHTAPVRADHMLLPGKYSKYRLAKYCLNHQAIIYPSSVFRKYRYNLKYRMLADYHLNLQLWGDESFKKIYYPISIVRYNMDGRSSVTKDENFEKDKDDIIRRSFGLFTFSRYLLKKYRKKIWDT